MKKTVIIAVLGMAACVASSQAQGFVTFTSYSANNNAGAIVDLFGTTTSVGQTYSADLYYAIGSVSDTVNNAVSSSVSAIPVGLTDAGLTGVTFSTAYNGNNFFVSGSVTIPGYTSGTITFEVVAFNGASYATSSIRGRSGTFTMSSIATGQAGVPSLGDNGTGFPNFYVAPVPEPTTLALAGLGGLASLVAIRRKKV